MNVIELYENVVPVVTRDEKLSEWVKRELKHLRLTYMDAHRMTSVQQYADHVGITKRHIYQLEDGKHSPTVDTLHQILTRCETNLVEFFQRLITRTNLTAIQRESIEEQKLIHVLVMGLSNPRTLRTVRDAALNVKELLDLLDVR